MPNGCGKNKKDMRHFIRHDLFVPVSTLVITAALLGAAYLGWSGWKNYRIESEKTVLLQNEERAKLEEDKILREESRDREIADLRQQLEELKKKPASVTNITTEITPRDNVADIVKKWTPRVASLKCSWYSSGGALRGTATASATLVNFTNLGIRAITSRHIFLSGGEGTLPRECKITPSNSSVNYPLFINDTNVSVGQSEDWAYVTLPNDAVLSAITKESVKLCSSVETGDRVLILGYPRIGSSAGLTATEGIVSGTDGDYYITSAKIDKGNSGGAAILVKDDCYLGIPSSSVVGTIESLGRILKASFVISN